MGQVPGCSKARTFLRLDWRDRGDHPVLEDRMLLHQALAEERDRGHVLERPGLDARRDESFTRVTKDEQLVVLRTRDRTEESCLGVTERDDLFRFEVVLEDVRNAGVVGAADERLAVGCEDEAGRD